MSTFYVHNLFFGGNSNDFTWTLVEIICMIQKASGS